VASAHAPAPGIHARDRSDVPPVAGKSARSTEPTLCLQVEGLAFAYRSRRVLEDVSFGVAAGELVGVIGPNGSGKSTLLRVVAGTLRPAAGRVRVAGADVAGLSRGELARRLAVVPQSASLPEAFSAFEIVLMGRTPHLGLLQAETARDVSIVRQAMLQAGVWDLADCPVGQLSGGERQRVVIARALAQQPALLLLDEPTSHLDVHHQVQVMEIVRDLCVGGLATLAVFHDLNLAAQYCDRLLLLHEGRIQAAGTPEEVVTPENVARVYGPQVHVYRHPANALPATLVAASRAGS